MARDMVSGSGNGIRQVGRRRTFVVAGLLIVQVLSSVFFVADVIEDFWWAGLSQHTLYEAAVALALLLGVVFGAREMNRIRKRNRQVESALGAASGALAEVIRSQFEQWGLTAAEEEVSLLAIKGFETSEIAEIRGTAEGTIRAQLTRVYEKADVANRAQLVSLFIDELIEAPVLGSETADNAASG